MEAKGGAPYVTAVRPAAEPEVFPHVGIGALIEPKPAASHASWVRNIGEYERRETTIVEGPRYG